MAGRSFARAKPGGIYVIDAEGLITYFNPACIDFTGRRPQVGADRWCVTWRLYANTGEFLPHDQCPIAVAITTKRPIRGVTAVAERPDGTRVVFRPYPTPIFDKHGRAAGGLGEQGCYAVHCPIGSRRARHSR
jgi:PAS domain-containing protein